MRHFILRLSGTCVLATCVLALCTATATAANTEDAVDGRTDALEARIADLIEQLGSAQFVRRETAQAELARHGLAAFDALHRAQDHEDIEIALRAKYLVRSMRVHWFQDDDPAEVKQILRDYQNQNPKERVNRMQRLSRLDSWLGTEALCRLVRFENSDVLSKRAALLVMQQETPPDAAVRADVMRRIAFTIGLSRRPSADWLRTYADSLRDPLTTVPQWEQLAARELAAFNAEPEKSSHETVRDLLRWQADMLREIGREDDALAVMKRSVQLQDGTREGLIETVDWLMERAAFGVVDVVAERYVERFDQDAILLYRLAEARLKQDEPARAEQVAQQALKLSQDDLEDHVTTAFALQVRGLADWSEREYRQVLELADDGTIHDLRARFMLAELLHDQQRELPAAEVLQVATDLMDKDAGVMQTVTQRIRRDPGGVKSRMHYFFARHFAEQGQRDKRMEHLRQGIAQDPTDADVLIAMHRLPDPDDEWTQNTRQLIRAAADQFRAQIRQFEQQVGQSRSEDMRALFQRQLAMSHNQLAWLISNTEGDFQAALRSSQKSLELRPDTAGYLDTLGRCYYALGDYVNAVRVQQRAVELEPFTEQIQRQLKLFQQALTDSQPNPETP